MEHRIYIHEHHCHTNNFLNNYFVEQLTKKLDYRYQEQLLQAKTKTKSQRQNLKIVATGQNSQILFPGQKAQLARSSEISPPITKGQKNNTTGYNYLPKRNISWTTVITKLSIKKFFFSSTGKSMCMWYYDVILATKHPYPNHVSFKAKKMYIQWIRKRPLITIFLPSKRK